MNTEKRIFTIVGPHAQETKNSIFDRKIKDIEKVGETFWVIKKISNKSLEEVQEFCEKGKVKIYFISPSTKGAAKDTKYTENNEYSKDGKCWKEISEEISNVTGSGYAFILESLEMKENSKENHNELFTETQTKIDINKYAKYSPDDAELQPMKFNSNASTILAKKENMACHKNKMKSNIRQVWAVGTLKYPYYVRVRNKSI